MVLFRVIVVVSSFVLDCAFDGFPLHPPFLLYADLETPSGNAAA